MGREIPQSQPAEHWHLRRKFRPGTEPSLNACGAASGRSAAAMSRAARRGEAMRTSISFAPSRSSFFTSKRQRRNSSSAVPARRPFTKISAAVSIDSNDR